MNGKVKGKKVVKKQDLNDLQNIINEAFSCIAAVKASGDAVDMIAAEGVRAGWQGHIPAEGG